MISDRPTVWFPAKRYGWGWGPPNCWQGWLVICGYIALVLAAMFHFRVAHEHLKLFATLIALTAALIGVMAVKGERPLRWRWGSK
jgi:hypothetical protein